VPIIPVAPCQSVVFDSFPSSPRSPPGPRVRAGIPSFLGRTTGMSRHPAQDLPG